MVDRYTIVTDENTLRDIEQDETDTAIREDRPTYTVTHNQSRYNPAIIVTDEQSGEVVATFSTILPNALALAEHLAEALREDQPTDEQINEMLERCFEIKQTARKKGN